MCAATLHDHAVSFPAAFEHWTLLALLRSQAAISDVAADPPPFEDQPDPIEFFRATTLDQQHIAWKQEPAAHRCNGIPPRMAALVAVSLPRYRVRYYPR